MCTRGSKYRPYDLNLPYTLPQIRFSNLVNDPPLTNFGRCYVHSVAKFFKNEQIRFARIFSGPSLRSVQMALIMAEYMGKTVEIVEDLKEPEAEEVPKYLTVEELKKCGYNVSEFVTSTTKSQVKSPNDLLQRLMNAIRSLSQIKGPVFISNGPLTLKLIESIADLPDGFVDPSANRPFKQPIFSTDDVKVDFTKFDFEELNEIVPFGSISAFEKQQDGSFIRWPYSLPKMTVH
uniref:Uncharacterized protein n=1 Tax=Panagrolaimus sp. JU765 TaxID=591449 RepID=A0AC34R3K2_9BILA